MAEQSQEEILAAQKANCPFCKMISGEIPTKKVYEDDQMLAILDINPANKGHLLVMPKEHYFILPLVPPETFKHMFLQAKKLMFAMRKGLIVPRVTLFIANGGAAGQQSPHFLFHLIPREDNDGLDHLDVAERKVKQENGASIAQNTKMIMRNLPVQPKPVAAATPAPVLPPVPATHTSQPTQPKAQTPDEEFEHPPQPTEAPQTQQEKLAALFELLQKEPGLHELLVKDPDKVVEYAKGNPLLQQVFAGMNLHELSAQLKQQSETQEVVPAATELNDEQLKQFLEEKPELKRLLEEDIPTLKKMMPSNERLQLFFAHTTPEAVAERINPGEPLDFDLLAQHLK